MNALASFLVEPRLWVLLMLFVLVLFVWYHGRRRRLHPAIREPQDLSAHFADTFVVKPYVQLGNFPRLGSYENIEILWVVKPSPAHVWTVQARVHGEEEWRTAVPASAQTLTIAALGDVTRCAVTLTRLPFGADLDYRVLCDGNIAFASGCRTRNGRGQPFRFVVAGDLGEPMSGKEQKIAYQMHRRSPNLVVVPGDIVYERGRVSEYMSNFFPVYNSDVALPARGAPLLRSVLMMGAAGNHDMGMPHADHKRDFTRFPDLLGYYLFFSQPLNGVGINGGANTPNLEGDEQARRTFLKAAGARYPRMASFSFEWGNSFWLVLDANAYMDWTDAQLRDWVDAELADSARSTWRFVTFHHPAFSSDGKHVNEQRMRLLAPIFEKHGVDIVFVGHVHCYERTHPLRFTPHKMETTLHTEDCAVTGEFVIDRQFDGLGSRRPDGVIYVTSGAGGAKFDPRSDPGKNLKPYTAKYDQRAHSFTSCELDSHRLLVRQIDEDGREIDFFVIEK